MTALEQNAHLQNVVPLSEALDVYSEICTALEIPNKLEDIEKVFNALMVRFAKDPIALKLIGKDSESARVTLALALTLTHAEDDLRPDLKYALNSATLLAYLDLFEILNVDLSEGPKTEGASEVIHRLNVILETATKGPFKDCDLISFNRGKDEVELEEVDPADLPPWD